MKRHLSLLPPRGGNSRLVSEFGIIRLFGISNESRASTMATAIIFQEDIAMALWGQ